MRAPRMPVSLPPPWDWGEGNLLALRAILPPPVQVFSAPVVICRVNTKITSCGADATCNLWVNTFSRAIFLVNVLKSECSESMVLPMLFSFSDSIKLINTFIKPVLGLKLGEFIYPLPWKIVKVILLILLIYLPI